MEKLQLEKINLENLAVSQTFLNSDKFVYHNKQLSNLRSLLKSKSGDFSALNQPMHLESMGEGQSLAYRF